MFVLKQFLELKEGFHGSMWRRKGDLMSRKFKLKKELPGIPVGTLFEKFYDNNFYPVGDGGYFDTTFDSKTALEVWFPDWFEEVSDHIVDANKKVEDPLLQEIKKFTVKLGVRLAQLCRETVTNEEPKKKIKLAPALIKTEHSKYHFRNSIALFRSAAEAKEYYGKDFRQWPAPPIDKDGYMEVEE